MRLPRDKRFRDNARDTHAPATNWLDTDRFSALGNSPLICVEAAHRRPPSVRVQAVIVGTDRSGTLPPVNPSCYDLLLTTAVNPPRPWIGIASERWDQECSALVEAVGARPQAATIFCQIARIIEQLPFAEALDVESLAYSALLRGREFAQWRGHQGGTGCPSTDYEIVTAGLVRYGREGDRVTLTLNDPDRRNAMTAAMRDALFGALASVLDDPTGPRLILRGAGRAFSVGGCLAEFGSAQDLAEAHIVRSLRCCARLLHALGERAEVHMHGACIGSGLEIPAAAHSRTATHGSFFQLPELAMGLIPGAGGIVTLSRAIGRHRTGWMLLTGRRISARTALNWGLVHTLVEKP